MKKFNYINGLQMIKIIRFMSMPLFIGIIYFNSDTFKVKPPVQSKYYLDIDIYRLKGINEITKIIFPCIEIKQSGQKRLIIYHVSKEISSSEEYTLVGKGLWFLRSVAKGDTTIQVYTYQYINDNKLIRFNYTKENPYKLLDASIMTGNQETTYIPESGLIVKPNVQNIDLIKKKASYTYVDEIIINDFSLKNISKRIDKNGRVIDNYANCYKVKNHQSYTWWTYFGKYLKEIPCN